MSTLLKKLPSLLSSSLKETSDPTILIKMAQAIK
jgi:hypothetical protein